MFLVQFQTGKAKPSHADHLYPGMSTLTLIRSQILLGGLLGAAARLE